MSDLLKELCQLSGFISDLAVQEKEPMTKKRLLELLTMVSDKIETAAKYPGLTSENDYFHMVIEEIKETENVIAGYKEKIKTYTDLLEHVMKVANEVDVLFLGAEFTAKLLTVNQTG